MSNNRELKEIFEYELKTKLSEKAKSSTNELKTLLNCFRYYDINKEGLVDESLWIKSILRTGITGFSQSDLEVIFRTYVKNPTDSINYQEFCNYIFGKEDISKISYTQMKNKKLKSDLKIKNINNNKEINYVNNNFQNIDLNKYNRTYLNKQREYESVSNKYMNNNYELLLEKIKEKIHINNGTTFYTFIKNLKTNEETLSQTISIDELSLSLQQLKLNISSNDIYDFFNYLDIDKKGRVPTNIILILIKGKLNERRKLYLNKIFKILDKEKKGEISINKLKNIFNSKNHPDVLNKIKNEDEIYNQFCYTLDIYIRYNNILNYSINNDKDDEYFENILEGVWNEEKEKKEKKKYYNIIYKNNYDYYQEESEMGLNSIFFGLSNSQRPKYNYDYDYLEEFYKTPGVNSNNNYNKINKKINKDKIKNNFRNKTKEDLYQNNLNNDLNFNTLNKSNNNKISKKYFGYESEDKKENFGIRIFKKKRYNPITDEFIQENNSFNNGYNTINKMINNYQKRPEKNEELIKEEINPEENDINKVQENKENSNTFRFNSFNNNIKENESLIKFRKYLISQGARGIFRFQKMLSIYDRNNSGFISFDNFYTIFQSNYTNISLSDIKSIFSLFENNNNESQINSLSEYKIKYDLLLKSLVGNISIKRRILIQKVFNSFNKDKNNKVLLSDIKNRFNASKHPDFIKGIKTENKILGEFLDFLETFREYNTNLHGFSFSMTFQEFFDFYSQISLSIDDDKYFEMLLFNCWDLDKLNKKEEGNNNNEKKENNTINIKNNYKRIVNGENNENKQFKINVRMKVGSQIVNNRIFY